MQAREFIQLLVQLGVAARLHCAWQLGLQGSVSASASHPRNILPQA